MGTLTLTTRRVGCELGAFVLGGYERSGLDTAQLGKELSVCSMNFARNAEEEFKVDDWAFEPCGYSMNGLRDRFYYTIHVTPESGFSYASFETNDPQYREPKWVERIASTFKPTALTLTLTTRRVGCELGAFVLGGYERSGLDTAQLGKELSV